MCMTNRVYFESKGVPTLITVLKLIYGGLSTFIGFFSLINMISHEKEMKFFYQMGLSDENPEVMIPVAMVFIMFGILTMFSIWKSREAFIRVSDSKVEGLSTYANFLQGLTGIISAAYRQIPISDIKEVIKCQMGAVLIATDKNSQIFYVKNADQAVYAVYEAMEALKSENISEPGGEWNEYPPHILTPPQPVDREVYPTIDPVPSKSPWKIPGDL